MDYFSIATITSYQKYSSLQISIPLLSLESMHLKSGHGWSSFLQLVKNPPAMQETPGGFLGQEDPLEKG